MNNTNFSRRDFLGKMLIGATAIGGVSLIPNSSGALADHSKLRLSNKRIGIIGLDTSHSEVFSRMINEGKEDMLGFKVVAAYPHGSKDIASALQEKPGIIKAVQAMGITIVDSIEELLKQVDCVLLESNDGRVHLEQALQVFKAGKPVFIDKPIAQNYAQAKAIFQAAEKYKVPVFSSSALRYDVNVQKVVQGSIGKVTGADVYTPAVMEPSHLDLAWYGIHGVEMLFTVMGSGCKTVSRVHQEGTDLLVGVWNDGRIGTVRGIRQGASNIAGTAFGEKGIAPLGPFSTYEHLVKSIVQFFASGVAPVSSKETLEIFAFMQAADASRKKGGAAVGLQL